LFYSLTSGAFANYSRSAAVAFETNSSSNSFKSASDAERVPSFVKTLIFESSVATTKSPNEF